VAQFIVPANEQNFDRLAAEVARMAEERQEDIAALAARAAIAAKDP
jgi:hypothetical protein